MDWQGEDEWKIHKGETHKKEKGSVNSFCSTML